MLDLKDKKVTVMGLGLHGGGIGAAKWLLKKGARVTVTDLKEEKILAKSLQEVASIGLPFEQVLGKHRDQDFTEVDLVIKNPGVPNNSKYLAMAREAGVAINTDIGIFFEYFPGPIVGVTGTKGKTTTTTLLYEILKAAKRKLLLGGNLRRSPLDDLDSATPDTLAVLELSSFQLEILSDLKRSPQVSVWTNIYPDHLDRYEGMPGYIDAKAQIFLHQRPEDYFFTNADQPELVELAKKARGRVVFFSTSKELPEGVFVREKNIVWRRAGQSQAKPEEKIIGALTSIKLMGEHNIANVLAAVAAALVLGVPLETVREVIETFRGVANRLELIREIKGVKYINDTASTIPTSTIVALKSFKEPIVLIAGGHDKKLPLEVLAQAIQKYAHKVILFDTVVGHKLYDLMKTSNEQKLTEIFVQPFAKSMVEAVAVANASTTKGCVVLLSPGAASFGMFQNEFDRGDQFVAAVKAL